MVEADIDYLDFDDEEKEVHKNKDTTAPTGIKGG